MKSAMLAELLDREEHLLMALGVLISLDVMVGDDPVAQAEWLSKPRPEFDGVSALAHMLDGEAQSLRDVVDLLGEARRRDDRHN